MHIDLNADMGEGFGAYRIGHDEELVGIVTSANVACGFHGGDATIMHGLAVAAAGRGVALGAHPGFNDLWGFGRRAIPMPARELEYMVAYQIGALQALAAYANAPLRHVKPHGALYNMAATDAAYAGAIAGAVRTVDDGLILVGPPGSELEKAADLAGLFFAREGFCDRLYREDGSLVPRGEPGAVIANADAAALQALRLATEGVAYTAGGGKVKLEVDTLCVHGDEPGAVAVAKAVRRTLEQVGVELRALSPSVADAV
ncbi:5-oxoprolinase subunit PxpA [Rhodomicrobium vannielii ATCC 17100]|uniref:LamB/YcsF family protein n=1 Tax=Rhodomicrobium vannielii TaxID=1069 RepID=UPI001919057B|nr:5-oxoprolinase subunit PxpA [Rhodomicrobium vannielii]MBJ7535614.1 5-oxoprolinase subunit PxpA [Rhodomicrobium vannielii ATCC 17100]